jgi:adenosylmethionine-8-amino-7-oxononanoate aminotransferase
MMPTTGESETADLRDPAYLRHTVLDFRQMSAFVRDPLIFDRAEGVHYWDVDGNHYYDGISGIFVVNVGHGNPRVIEALHQQMQRLCFAPPLHGSNAPAVRLSALLAELAPGDLNTVKLISSGSEATETAMKLSRQFWKQSGCATKYKFISRYYGYHGATLGAMSATGTPTRRVPFEPLANGYVHIPTVHCYRCPYERTYPECGVFCARYLRQVIELEGPETVAAVILEPIGNTGGILVPPPEYLPTIRRICDDLNVLLIFDEMITGMGRTGQMFAADTYGVTPDILCLGKGLSSGYAPLAATIWSDRIQEAFWGPPEAGIEFGHGHTFAGNPLSATAGLASAQEVLDRDLLANARRMGDLLRQRLNEMGERYGVFGEVRGAGLLWGVELARDPTSREPFPAEWRVGKRIGAVAQELGLILRHDPHWFALAPPLIVTEEEIDAMCAILDASIKRVLVELPT